jgi:hypothetical protein
VDGRGAAFGWPLLFGDSTLRTFVYVDAFNLYYGALRKSPFRWLDLQKLCQLMLPKNDIQAIKYFTALVSARPGDADQPLRQQLYIRALKTIPNIEIIYGHYLTHVVRMPKATPPGAKQEYVQVSASTEMKLNVSWSRRSACWPDITIMSALEAMCGAGIWRRTVSGRDLCLKYHAWCDTVTPVNRVLRIEGFQKRLV